MQTASLYCTWKVSSSFHRDERDRKPDTMSGSSKAALKMRLLELKCHFNWKFNLKRTDPDELAEQLYNQLTFLVPKNKYMVYNLLAYVMHLKGDYTKAIAELEKAEEIIKEHNPNGTGPKYLVTYGNYAWVFYCLNQYEDSQKYIDKVEQINKELKDSPDMPLIYGEKAWSQLKVCGKYYKESKQGFQKALELEPEDPEWNSGYASMVYKLEGSNGRKRPASQCESLDLLKRAIEKNPKDVVVKAFLALTLQDLKRVDEGTKYIEEALEQAPNYPYLLCHVAIFYRRAGMVDQALRVLKTAVDLIPTSGFVYHQISLCYKKKYFNEKKRFGDDNIYDRQTGSEELNDLLQNTLFHFEKVVEYNKTYVYAYVDLANMYCEAKQYQKAEDTFKTVLAFTNLEDNEKQQVYYNYGRFKEYYKRSESEAINYYKKSLQIALPTKERELSEKALKRISSQKIMTDVHDAEGFALLGFVHKMNGERNDAIDFYEKALKYDPYNEEYVSELCELELMI